MTLDPGPIDAPPSLPPLEPVVPVVPGAPSWLTGEFYTAIAPLAAAIGGLIAGHHLVPDDVERQLIGFGTVVAGLYALARTVLKMVHVHSAAAVARAQSIAVAQAAARTPSGPPVDMAALSAAVVDELDRRFVLQVRRTPRKRAVDA